MTTDTITILLVALQREHDRRAAAKRTGCHPPIPRAGGYTCWACRAPLTKHFPPRCPECQAELSREVPNA